MEETVKDNEFYCEFCSQQFDLLNHKPISLVPCGHSMCSQCYNCLSSTFCIYCKNEFEQVVVNWEIVKYFPQAVQSGSVNVEFECQLCLENFDKFDKKPLVLVPCGHTSCSQCLNELQNSLCPYCRLSFEKTFPNWQIIERIYKPSYTYLSDLSHSIKFQTNNSRAFIEVFSTLNSLTHLSEPDSTHKFDSEVFYICFLVLFLGIYPISMVIVGSLYKDECNANKLIPIWLIVHGFVTFAIFSLLFVEFYSNYFVQSCKIKQKMKRVLRVFFILAMFALISFSFGWCIFGFVQLTKIKNNESTDCHSTLLTFSRCTATISAFSFILMPYICQFIRIKK